MINQSTDFQVLKVQMGQSGIYGFDRTPNNALITATPVLYRVPRLSEKRPTDTRKSVESVITIKAH